MHVFLTGASGWIGSAVVPELVAAGHRVTGLARSERAVAALTAAGVDPVPGSLADLDVLRAAATEADAVIHLGFVHDFANFAAAGRTERAAVEALGSALEGSGRPLLLAAGVAGLAPGRLATERDPSPFSGPDAPRGGSEQLALGYAERGVRAVSLRFAPTVHGDGDHGFLAELVRIARVQGVSGYLGDGSSRWPAVHRLDAARLVRLALEQAPAGAVVHAVAEEGVATRLIAEVVGRHLDLPVVSVRPEDAEQHFGWLGAFFGLDLPTSSALTRDLLGWTPTRPGLLDDLEAGHYFRR